MYGKQYEFLHKNLKKDELKLDEEKDEETDGKKKEDELVIKEKYEKRMNDEEELDEKKMVEEGEMDEEKLVEKKKKDEFYLCSMESLSKVMIIQGIGYMTLKSLATLLSVAGKFPKDSSVEVSAKE
ncbi:hypothetical protein LOK49_LG01G00130 [Camellia lanceoleosa]|uniref:Uncharacterized protein n=1 Tax=Camellia lanceoleosa TaxID=1840588 RepID=A0ACC0J2A2_9ERIC|nr:hypothetical protein LOK49_LG01G00130 [Camellia lanceoleosa]